MRKAIPIDDFTRMTGAEFYDIPRFTGKTGATVGEVVITGDPSNTSGITTSFSGNAADPGDGAGWFAGGDQNPPCSRVVLDFSEPVRAFGVSFLHFIGAGVNATKPGKLGVFDRPGGQGEMIGEVTSEGGNNVVDFVGIESRSRPIRSAVVCCEDESGWFSADGYAVVAGRPNDPREDCDRLRAQLQEITDDNPGTPLADKIEDALAKAKTACDELNKTPPDNPAAVGNIEGAVGDLEQAVLAGLLDPTLGTQLMDEFAEVAQQLALTAIDEAIARGGNTTIIAEAEQALGEGDVLRGGSGVFKGAVNKYHDALAKAESA